MNRSKVFTCSLLGIATFLLFWWPLSHWFYYEWYNNLLGFTFSATNDGLVKMIGTCGLLPVLCLVSLAFTPKGGKPLLISLSAFSVFLGGTFLFLVMRGDFPTGELLNVVMTFGLAVFLPVLFWWSGRD